MSIATREEEIVGVSVGLNEIMTQQGHQSKCKSGKAQRYNYDGYKTALAAAKGSLI